MKNVILLLAFLNLTACSTAGFAHGFKCSYVNCNTAQEMNMSQSARQAEGESHYADTDIAKRVQAARDHDPELAKKMDAAVSDDTVIIKKRRSRNGSVYYEAR